MSKEKPTLAELLTQIVAEVQEREDRARAEVEKMRKERDEAVNALRLVVALRSEVSR